MFWFYSWVDEEPYTGALPRVYVNLGTLLIGPVTKSAYNKLKLISADFCIK
jgi:hypothetical protein